MTMLNQQPDPTDDDPVINPHEATQGTPGQDAPTVDPPPPPQGGSGGSSRRRRRVVNPHEATQGTPGQDAPHVPQVTVQTDYSGDSGDWVRHEESPIADPGEYTDPNVGVDVGLSSGVPGDGPIVTEEWLHSQSQQTADDYRAYQAEANVLARDVAAFEADYARFEAAHNRWQEDAGRYSQELARYRAAVSAFNSSRFSPELGQVTRDDLQQMQSRLGDWHSRLEHTRAPLDAAYQDLADRDRDIQDRANDLNQDFSRIEMAANAIDHLAGQRNRAIEQQNTAHVRPTVFATDALYDVGSPEAQLTAPELQGAQLRYIEGVGTLHVRPSIEADSPLDDIGSPEAQLSTEELVDAQQGAQLRRLEQFQTQHVRPSIDADSPLDDIGSPEAQLTTEELVDAQQGAQLRRLEQFQTQHVRPSIDADSPLDDIGSPEAQLTTPELLRAQGLYREAEESAHVRPSVDADDPLADIGSPEASLTTTQHTVAQLEHSTDYTLVEHNGQQYLLSPADAAEYSAAVAESEERDARAEGFAEAGRKLGFDPEPEMTAANLTSISDPLGSINYEGQGPAQEGINPTLFGGVAYGGTDDEKLATLQGIERHQEAFQQAQGPAAQLVDAYRELRLGQTANPLVTGPNQVSEEELTRDFRERAREILRGLSPLARRTAMEIFQAEASGFGGPSYSDTRGLVGPTQERLHQRFIRRPFESPYGGLDRDELVYYGDLAGQTVVPFWGTHAVMLQGMSEESAGGAYLTGGERFGIGLSAATDLFDVVPGVVGTAVGAVRSPLLIAKRLAFNEPVPQATTYYRSLKILGGERGTGLSELDTDLLQHLLPARESISTQLGAGHTAVARAGDRIIVMEPDRDVQAIMAANPQLGGGGLTLGDLDVLRHGRGVPYLAFKNPTTGAVSAANPEEARQFLHPGGGLMVFGEQSAGGHLHGRGGAVFYGLSAPPNTALEDLPLDVQALARPLSDDEIRTSLKMVQDARDQGADIDMNEVGELLQQKYIPGVGITPNKIYLQGRTNPMLEIGEFVFEGVGGSQGRPLVPGHTPADIPGHISGGAPITATMGHGRQGGELGYYDPSQTYSPNRMRQVTQFLRGAYTGDTEALGAEPIHYLTRNPQTGRMENLNPPRPDLTPPREGSPEALAAEAAEAARTAEQDTIIANIRRAQGLEPGTVIEVTDDELAHLAVNRPDRATMTRYNVQALVDRINPRSKPRMRVLDVNNLSNDDAYDLFVTQARTARQLGDENLSDDYLQLLDDPRGHFRRQVEADPAFSGAGRREINAEITRRVDIMKANYARYIRTTLAGGSSPDDFADLARLNRAIDDAYDDYRQGDRSLVRGSQRGPRGYTAVEQGLRSLDDDISVARQFEDADRPGVDRVDAGRTTAPRQAPGRFDTDRLDTGRAGVRGADVDRLDVDRPGTDRTGIDRVGMRVSDVDRFDVDRPDTDRAGLRTADADRFDVDRPDTDRAALRTSDVDRTGFDRPGTDRGGVRTADVDRTDVDRPGTDRGAPRVSEVDRFDVDRPGTDRPDVERLDVDRAGVERLEADRPHIQRAEVERPDVERLDVDRADVERLEADRPDIERTEVERPDVDRTEVERPEIERPGTGRVPGVGRPPTTRPPTTERPPTERPPTERPPTERPPTTRLPPSRTPGTGRPPGTGRTPGTGTPTTRLPGRGTDKERKEHDHMDCPKTTDPCKGTCGCSPDINIRVDVDNELDSKQRTSGGKKGPKGKKKAQTVKRKKPTKKKAPALKRKSPRKQANAALACPPAVLSAQTSGTTGRQVTKPRVRKTGAGTGSSRGAPRQMSRGSMFKAMVGR